MVACYNCA